MTTFEAKVLKEFETLQAIQQKMEGIETIRARLDELDVKFGEQVARLDQVQSKVDLSVSSIGAIHQDNVHVARVLKSTASSRDSDLERMAAEGCYAASPSAAANFGGPAVEPPPPLSPHLQQHHRPPETRQVHDLTMGEHDEGGSNRRTWLPKMEFPRFGGDGVRMWLDNCAAYFLMYNIPANFKIMSASAQKRGSLVPVGEVH